MKIKKLNIKKLTIFISLTIIFLLSLFWGINTIIKNAEKKKSDEYKLLQVGYSEPEISEIILTFDEKTIQKIIKSKYSSILVSYMQEEYFEFNLLDKYSSYAKNNENLSSDKVISIVNIGADNEWYSDIVQTDISKETLMLVNKFNTLSSDYVPRDLMLVPGSYAYEGNYISESIYDDLSSMLSAAREEGYTLVVTQGYRSYEEQSEIYDSYKTNYSTKEADEIAARPGHSEYQTGLSVMIVPYNKVVEDVENNEENIWLKNNAYKYGFVLRYEKDKENLTGFNYDPWRFRYVGKQAARIIHDKKLTFDEYYRYYVNN